MIKLKNFNRKLILFILCLVFLIFVLFYFFYNNTKNNVKCNMKYALCPAAQCVPDTNDESKAYCFCDVVNGTNYSLGNNNCENIKPYTTKSGEEIIFSDFSPIIEKMGYHVIDCPPDAINLNCMNKICSVNPNDSTKAICVCDKTDNKGLNWKTYNKNGEPNICNYKSGATSKQYSLLLNFIKQNE